MSGGSQQTSSQSTSSAPWQPSQGYLQDSMAQAQKLLDKKKGFNPYPGGSYVPLSAQTTAGLDMTQSIASQPNQFYGGAADFTKGLMTVLGTQRVAINNHTVTDPRSTSNPGPVIGLKLAAS